MGLCSGPVGRSPARSQSAAADPPDIPARQRSASLCPRRRALLGARADRLDSSTFQSRY